MASPRVRSNVALATFAGGCFWCMQEPFEELEGVTQVMVGYTGGIGEHPTYHDYAQKGYVEGAQITYDPNKTSYSELLDVFWRQIDPTDPGGQFSDRGHHYRSAIFYHTQTQRKEAEESKRALESSGRFSKKIVTEILPFSTFYPAESYHQDYYSKNPSQYALFKTRSKRAQFLSDAWRTTRKEDELRKKLTPMQFEVICCNATEPPFNNEYWDTKMPGIYVDRVSGEPLFSSLDKYDSGTGWPSFTKPLDTENITEHRDTTLPVERIEVRSRKADSHLGHLFSDGPQPTGQRYCVNSAALRFIPLADLEAQGYGKYKALFQAGDRNKK